MQLNSKERKIVNYMTTQLYVPGDETKKFDEKILSHLKDGWSLYGSLIVTSCGHAGLIYTHELVKYEDSDKIENGNKTNITTSDPMFLYLAFDIYKCDMATYVNVRHIVPSNDIIKSEEEYIASNLVKLIIDPKSFNGKEYANIYILFNFNQNKLIDILYTKEGNIFTREITSLTDQVKMLNTFLNLSHQLLTNTPPEKKNPSVMQFLYTPTKINKHEKFSTFVMLPKDER